MMLSGETASGKYPLRAVKLMRQTSIYAEETKNYRLNFINLTENYIQKDITISRKESLASSAVHTSYQINCNYIICITSTGNNPTLISKYRPIAHILVFSENLNTLQ